MTKTASMKIFAKHSWLLFNRLGVQTVPFLCFCELIQKLEVGFVIGMVGCITNAETSEA